VFLGRISPFSTSIRSNQFYFVVQLVEKATIQENNIIFHRQNSKSKSREKSQLNKASFDSVSNTITNLKTDDSLVNMIHPIILPNNTSK
jgi:hypothetical protein